MYSSSSNSLSSSVPLFRYIAILLWFIDVVDLPWQNEYLSCTSGIPIPDSVIVDSKYLDVVLVSQPLNISYASHEVSKLNDELCSNSLIMTPF